MTDAQWDSLMIPINMAFFFRSSPEARVVAMYPSPAGATESLLSLEAWNEIADANPELQHMDSDVEALLVNRIGHSRGFTGAEYYLAANRSVFSAGGNHSQPLARVFRRHRSMAADRSVLRLTEK